MKKTVTIYTDGACSGNPGRGGYAAILIFGKHRKEISGGFRLTTNNRMELKAAIEGLKALRERCAVELYSDSKYVVDAIEQGWAEAWRAKNWRRGKAGEKAKNPDLWKELLDLCKKHRVKFCWVKGHDESEDNNRCDELAVLASSGDDLGVDEEYEREADSED